MCTTYNNYDRIQQYYIVLRIGVRILEIHVFFAGFVIGITSVAIIIEILMIVLRFVNIGLVNLKIKIFLIIVSWDIV